MKKKTETLFREIEAGYLTKDEFGEIQKKLQSDQFLKEKAIQHLHQDTLIDLIANSGNPSITDTLTNL
jgi:hypothetical protein